MSIASERTRNGLLTLSESTECTLFFCRKLTYVPFLCVRSKSAIASIFMPDQELDIPGQIGYDRHARALASPPFALPAARAEKRDAHDCQLRSHVSDCGVAAGV